VFVDRQKELAFLNSALSREHPGPAQLILLYGRRRVGKTSLLAHWATQAGIPATYWSAEKEPAARSAESYMRLFWTFLRTARRPSRARPMFGMQLLL
jgi:hypothetical protein